MHQEEEWPFDLIDQFDIQCNELCQDGIESILNEINSIFQMRIQEVPASEFQWGFQLVVNHIFDQTYNILKEDKKITLSVINTLAKWIRTDNFTAIPTYLKWSLSNLQISYFLQTHRHSQAQNMLNKLREEQALYSLAIHTKSFENIQYQFQEALTNSLACKIQVHLGKIDPSFKSKGLGCILKLQQILIQLNQAKSNQDEWRKKVQLLMGDVYIQLGQQEREDSVEKEQYYQQAVHIVSQVLAANDPILQEYQGILDQQVEKKQDNKNNKKIKQKETRTNSSTKNEFPLYVKSNQSDKIIILEENKDVNLLIDNSGNFFQNNLSLRGTLNLYLHKIKCEIKTQFIQQKQSEITFEHFFNLTDVQNDLSILKNDQEGNFAAFLNEFLREISKILSVSLQKKCLILKSLNIRLILESFSKEVVVQSKSTSQSLVYFSDISNEDCELSGDEDICPLIYNAKKQDIFDENDNLPIEPLLVGDKKIDVEQVDNRGSFMPMTKWEKDDDSYDLDNLQPLMPIDQEQQELEQAALKIQKMYKKKKRQS